jgi:signal transduction histidine kinase
MTAQKSLIEELHAVNQKLLASEQLKSNFLSNIRNEINNPMASLLELARNIAEGGPVERVKKFANLIYSETFNLDFQLRNIFCSAEIEAGELALSVISVDMGTLISNVIADFRHQAEKKELTIVVSNSIDAQAIFHTDAEKLHLIISNLISNAIRYSHHGGRISIDCRADVNEMFFSIRDEGVGIGMKDTDLVFDRFRQLEEGSTKTHGGHGLGLSITKALLEIISGEMSVESEKDKGSTFTIRCRELQPADTDASEVFSANGNDFLF